MIPEWIRQASIVDDVNLIASRRSQLIAKSYRNTCNDAFRLWRNETVEIAA
ncbi:hypothetical protein RGAI101_3933 [Roseobacter sp. GAI101]|nr:hypothetical protein RGAI101_3933 [Roseobacter sp. GAI101]